jgi:ATP-dependent Lon protease
MSQEGGISGNNNDFYEIIIQKVIFYEDVIKKTFISLVEYKKMNIIGSNEINYSINELNVIMDELRLVECHIKDKTMEIEDLINDLQLLNNKISKILKMYGTNSLEHLIFVCFGNDYFEKNIISEIDKSKYEILVNYAHPLSYKVVNESDKGESSGDNPILEDIYNATHKTNLYCYQNRNDSDNYNIKLNTLKVVIQNKGEKTSLVVVAAIDIMMVEYLLSNQYMYDIYYDIKDNLPNEIDLKIDLFDVFYKSLSLRDFLINDKDALFEMYRHYLNSLKIFRNRPLSKIISEFIKTDLVCKRRTLIQLLLDDNDTEFQYLAYLLYDTISNDDKNKPDTNEQIALFDSLPWNIKVKFKCAMKQTVEYTHNLLNSDGVNKVPMEQRICLLKVNDSVKEKAMMKLKEIKSKSDDSTSKARQWLDGLLKIPFHIYKQEPIFNVMKNNIYIFKLFYENHTELCKKYGVSVINNINNIQAQILTKKVFDKIGMTTCHIQMNKVKEKISKIKKGKFTELMKYLVSVSEVLEESDIEVFMKLKKIDDKKKGFNELLTKYSETPLVSELVTFFDIVKGDDMIVYNSLNSIMMSSYIVNNYMKECKKTLDDCVYGHTDAKRQIERIVGQWINGKDSGYCLGFEGPPGVGKTSLAKKGLANCLKDENGVSRPFSFIAIGGSSNGTTLEGHNYTYVGSQWGKIVDILMDTKCMNPIIFIDEIDKVSRTESGKEIISILTHLIDQTQNDVIQDKYFSGVDLDLSKVLFVFSYNDVNAMDKILLDRIHRIKFDNLNLDEKLIICNKYLLPELYERVGQEGNIFFSDEILEYIIEDYTCESGVRKLKEILFEIIGEVNLDILSNDLFDMEFPIKITIDNVKDKYLKNRTCLKETKIHNESIVGIINGLWANSMGRGGIIQIESSFIPTSGFLDLKLTGQQGDVMKESMEVAKSLAWKLTNKERQESLVKEFEKIKTKGIHIHCPEGATPKDGPSAGTAITTCLYSLLNDIKIKNNIAITGEINMQGCVTAIGGLDLKILGGIKAGVKTFLYPKENESDFKKFTEKYGEKDFVQDINFHAIERIEEALSFSLENNN